MNNRTSLLISLLALGVILIGVGLWWKFYNSSENGVFYPIISMEVTNKNAGSHSNLYIDKSGTVVSIEIAETRSDLGRQGFEIWKKAQLSKEEFDNLIELFEDNINQLKDYYQGGIDGLAIPGDMDTVLAISYMGMARKISATDYLSAYSDQLQETYAGMPSPLDVICERLHEINLKTVEYYRQDTT